MAPNKDSLITLEKKWGTDEMIFYNSIMELHRLVIEKDGKSSDGKFHKHMNKYNLIYVEDGELDIMFINQEGEEKTVSLDSTTENTKFTIYPGIRHRFEAKTYVIAYELYYVFCNINDIHRSE